MIIYKTTNAINGKFYIGQDMSNNPNYLGSGIILNKAIKKYGKENFVKETLEYCNSKEELDEREMYWIKRLDAVNLGYNVTHGGTGGDTVSNHPDKTQILDKRANAIRQAYSLMSTEEKKKKFAQNSAILSSRQKLRMRDPSVRIKSGRSGKDHWAYGKKQSADTIEKRMKSWTYTAPKTGNGAPRKIKITNELGDILTFESIRACARHFKWTEDSIRYVLSQRKKGKERLKETYKIEYL